MIMKVYSWRQYWNNFNSWDEGLFQDANRPRDNDKFKIKPWLQSEKMDFRESNKNIHTDLSNFRARGSKVAWAVSESLPKWYTIPVLEKYAEKSDKGNDSWCVVKNWNVEIVESGTYIVQAFGIFKSSSAINNGYLYVENVWLIQYDADKEDWITLNHTQWRMCSNADQLETWQIWWFEAWMILNVWMAHTYWGNLTLTWVLNIERLK